jgi:pimeloyl-ACP methyl ester carboxylesterase
VVYARVMAMARRTSPAGRHLQHGGVPLWTETSGEGSAVLLLTGLGYATWCWSELVPPLASRWRTVAMDNRGTGRSGKPEGPTSIEQMAEDAVAVLDALDIPRAHVLGHSMGGYLALTLARNHPGRVRSLVLVATSAGGPGSLPVPQSTRAAWQAAAPLPAPEFARRTMPLSYAPGWVEANTERFERNLAHRLEFPTPPQTWAAQYAACERYLQAGIDAARITCPSLVIHGTADRVVPFGNGERLAEALPRARFLRVENGGHLWFLEAPETFARSVMEHLVSQEKSA